MPWISKKAKTQMRARRKKKERQTKNSSVEEDVLKKRPFAEEEEDTTQNDTEEGRSREWKGDQNETAHTVEISSTSTSKEARKIRKEARRNARKEGRDENLIKFVDENGKALATPNSDEQYKSENNNRAENESQEESSTSKPARKKRKTKTFPSINKILAEVEAAKQLKKEEEKRDAYENSIPEEIKAQYVALDCEMVGIGTEGKVSALARVSITGWNDEMILDTFVQVPDRVTDFRTFVSGVRAKDIRSTNENAMELHACRKKVGGIMKNKILIGHSLKNDFAALMMDHPKHMIRDTARYKPFMRASGRNGGKLRPRKLRDLVKEHCGLVIQKDGEEHTSVEDAQATMKLYKVVREKWEKEIEKAAASKRVRKTR